MQQQSGRVPPQAVEVEEQIIGALLTSFDHCGDDILALLQTKDFYKPAHRHIYDTIVTLTNQGKPVDMLSVETSLKDQGELDMVGGPHYMADLTRAALTSNFEFHCRVIKEKSIRRDVILKCNDVINNAYDSSTDTGDVLDSYSQGAIEVSDQSYDGKAITPSQIFEREKNTPTIEKLYFRMNKLDNGLFENVYKLGQVHLVIADSGHGKTKWGLSLAEKLMIQNIKGAWFQLEDTDINTADYFDRVIPEYKDNIFVSDDIYDIEGIMRESRRLKKNENIKWVFIDYVQNVECAAKYRNEQVEYISRKLTRGAKELKVVMNPLSQITINYQARHGWKQEPGYGDVRWSQQLKQDAVVISSVFRPSKVESLVANNDEALDWKQRRIPFNSVYIKQCKIRYAKQSWARLHMIDTDDGLKPYATKHTDPVNPEPKVFEVPDDEVSW